MSTSVAIETNDLGQDRLLSLSGEEDGRQETAQLIRKVYCLLVLRILCLTVMECYAIYDESISAFFSGSGGGVVIVMIWLIQIILSGYTSLSDCLGPDNPSNQNRCIALNVMECLVYSGAASNLYHSEKIQLIDVLILNGSLGIFHLGHVLFFLNPWLCYHGLYGAFHAALCIGTPLLAFNLSSSHAASGRDPSEGDDPSLATDWQSVRQVEIGCVGLLCCLWYSLETHVVVWKRHRFRFEQHQDCFFVLLCFGYADIWNVLAKCRLFVAKSTETTTQNGKKAKMRANAERLLAG